MQTTIYILKENFEAKTADERKIAFQKLMETYLASAQKQIMQTLK
ncbi:MAG: hypothetical protein RR612_05520 [Oscillospiraceae bacterium]